MTNLFDNSKEKLVIPALSPVYETFAQPLAWTILRLAVGLTLAYSGWGKIQNPFAMAGFVESLGFYPGGFWSALMAAAELFGGILIAVGLFTRPFALACGFILLVTLYYHIANPYPATFLTEAGLEALKSNPDLFTEGAKRSLADGGARFLGMMQQKAVYNSLFWSGATLLFAAFGGGYYSVDRMLKKRF